MYSWWQKFFFSQIKSDPHHTCPVEGAAWASLKGRGHRLSPLESRRRSVGPLPWGRGMEDFPECAPDPPQKHHRGEHPFPVSPQEHLPQGYPPSGVTPRDIFPGNNTPPRTSPPSSDPPRNITPLGVSPKNIAPRSTPFPSTGGTWAFPPLVVTTEQEAVHPGFSVDEDARRGEQMTPGQGGRSRSRGWSSWPQRPAPPADVPAAGHHVASLGASNVGLSGVLLAVVRLCSVCPGAITAQHSLPGLFLGGPTA